MKKKKYVYALKSVNSDMTSHNGFKWKKNGMVTAPDWNNKQECGGGLHAFLNGEGDGHLANWDNEAVWLVLKVEDGTYIDLCGKIKFPRCTVLFSGNRLKATEKLRDLGCTGAVIGSTLTGGDCSTLTGGYGSTLTGGYGSTLTGGACSTMTGGDCSTLTGGYRSTLTGGYGSTLTGGDGSTLTGGACSTLTGGYGSTLTGRDCSTLTGGDGSTLTGGDGSTLTGGYRSTLTLCYYLDRKRLVTRYVGEDGIKPNTPYRLNDAHEFEEVKA